MIHIDTSGKNWTFGTEHELADVDTSRDWEGYGRDPKEKNIVNSNGIAVDPKLEFYKFGAELNTPPTDSIDQQLDLFNLFLLKHRETKANYRCGMHIHIGIPGLRESLPHLKQLANYIFCNSSIYDSIDPLPQPNKIQHPTAEEFKEAKKRYKWMLSMHKVVIPGDVVSAQQRAGSLQEFWELPVRKDKNGVPQWHLECRAAVNIQRLRTEPSIEFRHFPQTLDLDAVYTALEWCKDYLKAAFDGFPARKLFENGYKDKKFPMLDNIYDHHLEQGWKSTARHLNDAETVKRNIAKILEEKK